MNKTLKSWVVTLASHAVTSFASPAEKHGKAATTVPGKKIVKTRVETDMILNFKHKVQLKYPGQVIKSCIMFHTNIFNVDI
jgi:hypothetical protein